MQTHRYRSIIRPISLFLCFTLLTQQSGLTQSETALPIGSFLSRYNPKLETAKFRPIHLRGISYQPPQSKYSFIIDKGDRDIGDSPDNPYNPRELLGFFLSGISLENSRFWVNLRPSSSSEMIDPFLAKTDAGRVMLEADIILKKDLAKYTSISHPQGREYWDRLYRYAADIGGAGNNINLNSHLRPWIVPDQIIIRRTQDSLYIYKATLKVMLEEDYRQEPQQGDTFSKAINAYSAKLARELILPKLSLELNTSKRYAQLRQLYFSLILAQSVKKFTPGQGQIHSYKIDSNEVSKLSSRSWNPEDYYREYLASYGDGEYTQKENVYAQGKPQVRTYSSGGISFLNLVSSSSVSNVGVIEAVGNELPKKNYLEVIAGLPEKIFSGAVGFIQQKTDAKAMALIKREERIRKITAAAEHPFNSIAQKLQGQSSILGKIDTLKNRIAALKSEDARSRHWADYLAQLITLLDNPDKTKDDKKQLVKLKREMDAPIRRWLFDESKQLRKMLPEDKKNSLLQASLTLKDWFVARQVKVTGYINKIENSINLLNEQIKDMSPKDLFIFIISQEYCAWLEDTLSRTDGLTIPPEHDRISKLIEIINANMPDELKQLGREQGLAEAAELLDQASYNRLSQMAGLVKPLAEMEKQRQVIIKYCLLTQELNYQVAFVRKLGEWQKAAPVEATFRSLKLAKEKTRSIREELAEELKKLKSVFKGSGIKLDMVIAGNLLMEEPRPDNSRKYRISNLTSRIEKALSHRLPDWLNKPAVVGFAAIVIVSFVLILFLPVFSSAADLSTNDHSPFLADPDLAVDSPPTMTIPNFADIDEMVKNNDIAAARDILHQYDDTPWKAPSIGSIAKATLPFTKQTAVTGIAEVSAGGIFDFLKSGAVQVLSYYNEPHPSRRAAAARAMGLMADNVKGTRSFKAFLSNPRGLGSVERAAIKDLSRAMLTDKDPYVRASSAWALGRYISLKDNIPKAAGSDPRVKNFEKALNDPEWLVRYYAVIGLQSCQDPRAFEPVLKSLRGETNPFVIAESVTAAVKFRDTNAAQAITQAAGELNFTLQEDAILYAIDGEAFMAISQGLIELAKIDKTPTLQGFIQQITLLQAQETPNKYQVMNNIYLPLWQRLTKGAGITKAELAVYKNRLDPRVFTALDNALPGDDSGPSKDNTDIDSKYNQRIADTMAKNADISRNIQELAAKGDNFALEQLALFSQNSAQRILAGHALGSEGMITSVGVLLEALNDPHPDVQAALARALRDKAARHEFVYTGDDSRLLDALENARNSRDLVLTAYLLDTLRLIGDSASLGVIQRLFANEQHPLIRGLVTQTLAGFAEEGLSLRQPIMDTFAQGNQAEVVQEGINLAKQIPGLYDDEIFLDALINKVADFAVNYESYAGYAMIWQEAVDFLSKTKEVGTRRLDYWQEQYQQRNDYVRANVYKALSQDLKSGQDQAQLSECIGNAFDQKLDAQGRINNIEEIGKISAGTSNIRATLPLLGIAENEHNSVGKAALEAALRINNGHIEILYPAGSHPLVNALERVCKDKSWSLETRTWAFVSLNSFPSAQAMQAACNLLDPTQDPDFLTQAISASQDLSPQNPNALVERIVDTVVDYPVNPLQPESFIGLKQAAITTLGKMDKDHALIYAQKRLSAAKGRNELATANRAQDLSEDLKSGQTNDNPEIPRNIGIASNQNQPVQARIQAISKLGEISAGTGNILVSQAMAALIPAEPNDIGKEAIATMVKVNHNGVKMQYHPGNHPLIEVLNAVAQNTDWPIETRMDAVSKIAQFPSADAVSAAAGLLDSKYETRLISGVLDSAISLLDYASKDGSYQSLVKAAIILTGEYGANIQKYQNYASLEGKIISLLQSNSDVLEYAGTELTRQSDEYSGRSNINSANALNILSAKLKGEPGTAALTQGLFSKDKETRMASMEEISKNYTATRDIELTKALTKVIENDADSQVRIKAMDTVMKVNPGGEVDKDYAHNLGEQPLINAIYVAAGDNRVFEVQKAALKALGAINHPQAVKIIAGLPPEIEDNKELLLIWVDQALTALQATDNPDLVEPLVMVYLEFHVGAGLSQGSVQTFSKLESAVQKYSKAAIPVLEKAALAELLSFKGQAPDESRVNDILYLAWKVSPNIALKIAGQAGMSINSLSNISLPPEISKELEGYKQQINDNPAVPQFIKTIINQGVNHPVAGGLLYTLRQAINSPNMSVRIAAAIAYSKINHTWIYHAPYTNIDAQNLGKDIDIQNLEFEERYSRLIALGFAGLEATKYILDTHNNLDVIYPVAKTTIDPKLNRERNFLVKAIQWSKDTISKPFINKNPSPTRNIKDSTRSSKTGNPTSKPVNTSQKTGRTDRSRDNHEITNTRITYLDGPDAPFQQSSFKFASWDPNPVDAEIRSRMHRNYRLGNGGLEQSELAEMLDNDRLYLDQFGHSPRNPENPVKKYFPDKSLKVQSPERLILQQQLTVLEDTINSINNTPENNPGDNTNGLLNLITEGDAAIRCQAICALSKDPVAIGAFISLLDDVEPVAIKALACLSQFQQETGGPDPRLDAYQKIMDDENKRTNFLFRALVAFGLGTSNDPRAARMVNEFLNPQEDVLVQVLAIDSAKELCKKFADSEGMRSLIRLSKEGFNTWDKRISDADEKLTPAARAALDALLSIGKENNSLKGILLNTITEEVTRASQTELKWGLHYTDRQLLSQLDPALYKELSDYCHILQLKFWVPRLIPLSLGIFAVFIGGWVSLFLRSKRDQSKMRKLTQSVQDVGNGRTKPISKLVSRPDGTYNSDPGLGKKKQNRPDGSASSSVENKFDPKLQPAYLIKPEDECVRLLGDWEEILDQEKIEAHDLNSILIICRTVKKLLPFSLSRIKNNVSEHLRIIYTCLLKIEETNERVKKSGLLGRSEAITCDLLECCSYMHYFIDYLTAVGYLDDILISIQYESLSGHTWRSNWWHELWRIHSIMRDVESNLPYLIRRIRSFNQNGKDSDDGYQQEKDEIREFAQDLMSHPDVSAGIRTEWSGTREKDSRLNPIKIALMLVGINIVLSFGSLINNWSIGIFLNYILQIAMAIFLGPLISIHTAKKAVSRGWDYEYKYYTKYHQRANAWAELMIKASSETTLDTNNPASAQMVSIGISQMLKSHSREMAAQYPSAQVIFVNIGNDFQRIDKYKELLVQAGFVRKDTIVAAIQGHPGSANTLLKVAALLRSDLNLQDCIEQWEKMSDISLMNTPQNIDKSIKINRVRAILLNAHSLPESRISQPLIVTGVSYKGNPLCPLQAALCNAYTLSQRLADLNLSNRLIYLNTDGTFLGQLPEYDIGDGIFFVSAAGTIEQATEQNLGIFVTDERGGLIKYYENADPTKIRNAMERRTIARFIDAGDFDQRQMNLATGIMLISLVEFQGLFSRVEAYLQDYSRKTGQNIPIRTVPELLIPIVMLNNNENPRQYLEAYLEQAISYLKENHNIILTVEEARNFLGKLFDIIKGSYPYAKEIQIKAGIPYAEKAIYSRGTSSELNGWLEFYGKGKLVQNGQSSSGVVAAAAVPLPVHYGEPLDAHAGLGGIDFSGLDDKISLAESALTEPLRYKGPAYPDKRIATMVTMIGAGMLPALERFQEYILEGPDGQMTCRIENIRECIADILRSQELKNIPESAGLLRILDIIENNRNLRQLTLSLKSR